MKHIYLTEKNNWLLKITIPKKGVVCSDHDQAKRISKILERKKVYKNFYGQRVYCGYYKNNSLFISDTYIGSGAGLVFTELFTAGAEYIIHYGIDIVKNFTEQEERLIKIIDETDNLYGFNLASGVHRNECGQSVFASKKIIYALIEEALCRSLKIEVRICHHVENYHAFINIDKFSFERKKRIQHIMQKIKRFDKKESFNMESAILFRVAKDFDKHAASVLQTIANQDNSMLSYNNDRQKKQLAINLEIDFAEYIFSAFLRTN